MITQNYQTLTPAYGRDYKSKKDVEADFRANKDFVLNNPFQQAYCSIKDFAEGVVVNIRYSKLTKVAVIIV